MTKFRLSSRLAVSRSRSAGDVAVVINSQPLDLFARPFTGDATAAAAASGRPTTPNPFNDNEDNLRPAAVAAAYPRSTNLTIDQQGRPISQLRTGFVKKGGAAKKVLSILDSPRKALLGRTRSARPAFSLSHHHLDVAASEHTNNERGVDDLDGRRALFDDDLSLPLLGLTMPSARASVRRLSSLIRRPSRTLRHVRSTSDRSHLVHTSTLENDSSDCVVPSSGCHHPNSSRGSYTFCSSCYMHWTDYKTHTNVMEWLHDEAPRDILPKVLSFLGPRKFLLISRINKSWRDISLSELVWRTLCEDYGKWRPGEDSEPSSTELASTANNNNDDTFWRRCYRDNIIVPIDYGTLESAFEAISSQKPPVPVQRPNAENGVPRKNTRVLEQTRNVRILLQPGKYVLRESLTVHAIGETTVSIETLDHPASVNLEASRASSSTEENEMYRNFQQFAADTDQHLQDFDYDATPPNDGSSISRRRNASTTLRNILMCRSSSATESTRRNDVVDPSSFGLQRSTHSDRELRIPMRHFPRRAILILKSSKTNEPIISVSKGTVRLRRLVLIHNSAGTDIWNGNAAVQIQPSLLDANDDMPRSLPVVASSKPPSSFLEEVEITSISGRGIVAIDGGVATIRNCYIHNCAATGIYVGGPGSVATIEQTDVLQNGNGNTRSRSGIARGHSGVYLEQGVATLTDCNISNNSLTGISAISSENARLTVEQSDLVGNGTLQLEMPPTGSISRDRSVSRNNVISAQGKGRPRSGLVAPEDDDIDGQDQANVQPVSWRREAQPPTVSLAIQQAVLAATTRAMNVVTNNVAGRGNV